jgi:hypothetical protein
VRGLQLLWIPDVADGGSLAFDDAVRATPAPDIVTDLYGQIVKLPAGGTLEPAFAAAFKEARATLLRIGELSESQDRLRVGLDVIVVARVTNYPVLGALERLLKPAVRQLAADPTLMGSGSRGERLHVIHLVDFDHFWDPAAADLRREFARWVGRLGEIAGTRGLSRMYLSDAHTTQGERDRRLRVSEAALFLEFLLFEDQRDATDLRRLYEREREEQSPLVSAAVRLLERSTGLVSRLAAAPSRLVAHMVSRGWPVDAVIWARAFAAFSGRHGGGRSALAGVRGDRRRELR